MITYSVKYKRYFFWKRIYNVKGDGLLENGMARFFIKEDETRIEVPCQNTVFHFSKDRFAMIKERMEIEAGQGLTLNKK